MLKGISPILPPDLLKALMEMGHSDELVLADANFPSASHAVRLIRCDGHSIPDLLEAILPLFPLDQYVEAPVALMQVTPGDPIGPNVPIWETYRTIVNDLADEKDIVFEQVERFQFYERAKKSYVIVATGEKALYANVILKKGVIS